jgi:hypothetical protein
MQTLAQSFIVCACLSKVTLLYGKPDNRAHLVSISYHVHQKDTEHSVCWGIINISASKKSKNVNFCFRVKLSVGMSMDARKQVGTSLAHAASLSHHLYYSSVSLTTSIYQLMTSSSPTPPAACPNLQQPRSISMLCPAVLFLALYQCPGAHLPSSSPSRLQHLQAALQSLLAPCITRQHPP